MINCTPDRKFLFKLQKLKCKRFLHLCRLNHAYQKSNGERKNGVRDGANEERAMIRQKPVSFSSCLRRNSGLIVMASMESDIPIDSEELFKEVAWAAALGYLPQDVYAGLSIFDVVHPADLKDLLEPLKKGKKVKNRASTRY